jgi:hypothetical protein
VLYYVSVGTPEGERRLGGHWRRWKDNIRMHLREIGWEIVNWIHRMQDRDQ